MRKKSFSFLGSFWFLLMPVAMPAGPLADEFSTMGADSCLPCHGEGSPMPATDIFFTRHASRSDSQAPFAELQCETCHGPGADHVDGQQRGENRKPVNTFGPQAVTPPTQQNAVCLGCHETGGRLAWSASRHETADVSCATCHRVHRPRDRVFDPLEQQETCFQCHPKKRADSLKTSTHPLRSGSMACSDCHDPHNGENDFLLRQATVNETCYTCHTEKQGPYLWEHAPASEDCSLCHRPHGSNHPGMLKKRAPLLCQQCHSPAGHPGNDYTSETLDDDFLNRFLLGRSCLNCHSQVHGSNHPSGATLHR